MDATKPVILVVDDESDSLKLLSEILRAEGCEVRAADSGRLALTSAAAHVPDLILLDLRMPGMDGLEVCHRLKQSEATRKVPLMFISGAADVEQRVQGLALGAVDFVTKPFRREELLARVRTHLELGQLRANLEHEVDRRTIELRGALDELRESNELVSLAAESAGAGLWALDFATGVFWATERAREIFGISPEEVPTLDLIEALYHPEDLDLVRGVLAQSLQERRPVAVEYRIVLANGGVRWVASRGRPHFRPTGEPHRLMGVTTDITEHKRDQEALRMSEARLAAGADLAGLGHYEVDFIKGAAYADERFRSLCGLPPDADQGMEPIEFWIEHLHPEDAPIVRGEREAMLSGKVERLSIEYRFLHPAQGQKWIQHLAGAATRDATGRATRTYGVLRDITERREALDRLRKSYAEIKELKERLQAEGEYLKAEMKLTQAHTEVIGQSPGMQEVLRMVEQVAVGDSTVLLLGETGTGKELIAKAIHRLSPRRNQLMVTINCAALPAGLVESELFGREKGAYTGALTRQTGRFEIADGSTLFLDEVGDLPLDLQVKLLRVLESGEFERLGSPRTTKVNVRLLAATNRDLADAMRKGTFREDLYYRLSVFPIHLPPLRERVEDIPLLVWRFLDEFSSRMGKQITQVPRKTMDALQRYRWPGNVRELRNVIEHGAIITVGDTLRIPLLEESTPKVVSGTSMTLVEAEREHILRALEKTTWHIKGPKGAAAQLGIKPGTLYSRMKKLGIQLRRQSENGDE